MKKRNLFNICIFIVLALSIVGLSGCNNKKDEAGSIIEQPIIEEKSENTPSPTPSEPSINTPYVIDTIAKAEITDDYTGYCCYTIDKNDNIYYIDNNCIYKANAYTDTSSMILDAKEVVIDNEEMALSDFEITSISYDDSNNKLFMTGKFNGVNSAKNVSSYYLYSVTDISTEVVTDKLKGGTKLIKILNNGDYVVCGDFYNSACILNSQTYEETDTKVSFLRDVYDNNTELYMIAESEMYKYNYIDKVQEWNKSSEAVGINSEYVSLAKDNVVELCNFSGKTIETISADDMSVLDRTAFETSDIESKLLLTGKNDIVFYDKAIKAFRIIKKNTTTVDSLDDI